MSILQKTILDITDISDYEKDHIWATFEKLKFNKLNASPGTWNRFNYFGIYKDETLDIILGLSIGYLYNLLNKSSRFDALLDSMFQIISNLLGRGESRIRKNLCDRKPILDANYFHLLHDLELSPTLIPREVVSNFHRFRISKWSDILGWSEFSIITKYGFTGKAISLINSLWSILPIAEEMIMLMTPLSMNKDCYESFDVLITQWVIQRVKNVRKDLRERRAQLLIERMGWGCNNPKTLEEVGHNYGVTRERVRQIESQDLKKLKKTISSDKDYFYPIYLIVDSCLHKFSGVASFETVSNCLKKHFKWDSAPSHTGFQNIIARAPQELFNIVVTDNNDGFLLSNNSTCIKCSDICGQLIDLLNKSNEVNLNEAVKFTNNFCRNKCRNQYQLVANFNKDFIQLLLNENDQIRGNIKEKAGSLYSKSEWEKRDGRLLTCIETLLKDNARSMHFSEVYNDLKKLRPNDPYLSERSVHGALDRSEDLFLWDRGTFIHREHITFPLDLINNIQEWIISKLKGGLPFISIGGVFSNFRRDCIANGIPTETALYISLREHQHNVLVLPKYPKIYLADSFTSRIPNSVILDDYLLEAGGPLPYKEIKKFFLENIGLKPFQLDQLLANEPKAVKISSTKYIHLDNVVFDKKEFKLNYELLILSTLNKAGKAGHISIKKAYNDKVLSFRKMGVTSVEMFRSLLKIYPSEKFNVLRGTHITTLDKEYSQGNVFKTECLSYIKNKRDFCTISELEEYFGKLGYNEQVVWSIRYRDNIYNYLRGAIIHADTIEWNDKKQARLESIASREYDESRKLNVPYGLIDRLLESDNLPLLPNNIFYTKLLIADILSKNGNWLVLGNAQNAFLPMKNMQHIKSFEDLIYVILKNQYGGAANLEQFQDELANLGIIQKRLTPLMLENSKMVTISGQEIVLTELKTHA